MNTAIALDPLRFPLSGSRLIEASAGTGKTFTIAALYVRLVLGHGGADAFARPLMPPEILVVTFTEAATQELRDRIRARLAEAAAFFRDGEGAPGDGLLHGLRADYAPDAWPACARRLQLAAEWMDEAAVSTIHGWCNRMLGEHAFDSDSLFTQRLETDLTDVTAEAVRDWWRSHIVPLPEAAARTVQGWWSGPAALQQSLRGLQEHLASVPRQGDTPAALIARCDAACAARLAELKAPWARWVDELQALLDAACDGKRVDARKLRPQYYGPWLAQLRGWAAEPAALAPWARGITAWKRLTPEGLREVWKNDDGPPAHPALDAIADLAAQLAALPDARGDVLAHAAHWVAERIALEQQRRAQMGFADLLRRLDAALQGPGGARLAQVIREQFPVALIDEFQDTDPVQYRIFDAVYDVAAHAADRAVVLIGDPKQAIYGFRGADIHTYLRARRASAGRHYTLGTNYRSTTAMVAAVNHAFATAERRTAGAFRFGGAGRDNPLPFAGADARGRDEHFVVDGEPAAALRLWPLSPAEAGGTVARGEHDRRMAAATAGEIVRLLQLGQQGRAGFDAQDGPRRALVPGDIAVLVNKGAEAQAVRAALRAAGVRSVYLSDRESVFAAPQAAELQRWLEACAAPEDGRLLRAALATPTLGLAWHDLDTLQRDELAWEQRVLQFRALRQRWRRQGVLPMLRRLLHDFGVPARLLAAGDERALTDLLHLAELLQQASSQLEGEHALIRHLAQEREAAAGGDEGPGRVRLESDAELVKVVTVHKSKGLEYPLVFLPFASSFRSVKPDDLPLVWHEDDGAPRIALAASAEAAARADDERLAEDLRKLYVALTRARHATWVGVAPLADFERGALGDLLGLASVDAAGLEAWRDGQADIAVLVPPEGPAGRYVPQQGSAPAVAPPPLPRGLRAPWWIASYSALRYGSMDDAQTEDDRPGPRTLAGAASAAEDVYAEARSADEPAALPATGSGGGLHGFPRGAGPGSFLHGLLEWAARERFDRVAADPAPALDQIGRRANLRGWSHWTAPLADWLAALLAAPLPLPGGGTASLAALSQYQVELEFWFAIGSVDTRALDALVAQHTLGSAPRPRLEPQRLAGMLKGFVDLAFEHAGRYYVLDYKSNWLGEDDAAYTPAALEDAVRSHRYELQYVLYVFALHRQLRARLPGYDYDRHVGGALCLFVRGVGAATRGVHAERPPRALIDALDELFTVRPPEARA